MPHLGGIGHRLGSMRSCFEKCVFLSCRQAKAISLMCIRKGVKHALYKAFTVLGLVYSFREFYYGSSGRRMLKYGLEIYYYYYYYYYYYLTAVGLTPGVSSTEHIYTQTVHRLQRMEHT
jgi:hypothetical protein